MREYDVLTDLKYIQECLGLTTQELADKIGLNKSSISRWNTGTCLISDKTCEKIYEFAYKNNLHLNEVKSQIYKETYESQNNLVLYHGAKKGISGDSIRIEESHKTNDFGSAFYLGDNFAQSATFVSRHPSSSIYIFRFNTEELKEERFHVDNDWMMTIAYYRNTLGEFSNHQYIQELVRKVDNADYIVAPIADNKMFEVIDEFIKGYITDIQCKHCLSVTNLGYQYVLKTDKAINNLECLDKCYISDGERKKYMAHQSENHQISENKLNYARRNFRNQGAYIDELLGDMI